MDLGGCFDEVLEMGSGEEVAEVDEFAVGFVFDVDYAPFVCAGSDHFAVDVEGFLGTDDGEGDDVLNELGTSWGLGYLDLGVEGSFFFV